MDEVMINLLGVKFLSDQEKDEFMEAVESEDEVFSFECIGIDLPLEAVSFKPLDDGFMFLFVTEEGDVKGELLALSDEFPGVSMDYLVIAPGDTEAIFSLKIEAGEVLSSQTIVGEAAKLIGEMAKGGFAG